jgi:hypothetical protein
MNIDTRPEHLEITLVLIIGVVEIVPKKFKSNLEEEPNEASMVEGPNPYAAASTFFFAASLAAKYSSSSCTSFRWSRRSFSLHCRLVGHVRPNMQNCVAVLPHLPETIHHVTT